MHPLKGIVLSILLTLAGGSQAANYCGDLTASFGPFDYRTRSVNSANFDLVESAHFTPDVENGVAGNTGEIGGDLRYTLAVVPNHHRALNTLTALSLRTKAIKLGGMKLPIECYFERAVRFAPDDGGARAAYANYLYAHGQTERAFAMFKEAAELDPSNAGSAYNLGLAYLRKKNYDAARTYAKKAYALDYPLQGLKNRLTELGKWDDKAE